MEEKEIRKIIKEYMSKPFTYNGVTIRRCDGDDRYCGFYSLEDELMEVLARCYSDTIKHAESEYSKAVLSAIESYYEFPRGESEDVINKWIDEHNSRVKMLISWDMNFPNILEKLGYNRYSDNIISFTVKEDK